MAETFMIIAKGIFDKKLKEMIEFRDGLKAKHKREDLEESSKKFREYELLVAELEKNYRKADKVLVEICRYFSARKSNGSILEKRKTTRAKEKK